ncbi:MAG TPA: protein-methionine-sulfoxide reductase heme-binding subunit MsrQ [Castellaniella sp.]|nr:protein-methionine-sulfoxide reductase heme-binding subunit MsrQ [Castellaniella sp.]
MARAAAIRAARILLFVICLWPIARWIWLGVGGGLGANPPEFLIRSSGIWALVALWLTLCATPLRRLLNWPGVIRHRRMMGLFAFFYTVLHMLAWGLWDRGADWAAMWNDLWQRDFILVGTAAVLCLLPLALTSTQASIRRLGRHWRELHTLIYPAAVLSVLHFYLMRAGKNDFAEPYTYAGILAVLLGVRLWWRAQRAK